MRSSSRVWRTDLAGGRPETIASFSSPGWCQCATGACSETCPEWYFWAPDSVVGDFFLVTRCTPGQLGATYHESLLYQRSGRTWQVKKLPQPLQRSLTASEKGEVLVAAVPDVRMLRLGERGQRPDAAAAEAPVAELGAVGRLREAIWLILARIEGVTQMSREQEMVLIRQVLADAERFQNDPEHFSQLLTQNAVIVNAVGLRISGKDEIAQVMQQAIQTHMADIVTKNEVVSITFVRSDVAVVNGIKHISVRTGNVLEEDSNASQTFMVVKEQGKWLIAAIQSTIIQI